MKIALYFDCQNVSHIFLPDVINIVKTSIMRLSSKKRIKILINIADGMRFCERVT